MFGSWYILYVYFQQMAWMGFPINYKPNIFLDSSRGKNPFLSTSEQDHDLFIRNEK